MARAPISPEFRFVCACCRPTAFDRDRTVAGTAREVSDWTRVQAIAKRHRVAGLVADAIRSGSVAVPSDARATIAADGRRIAAGGLRLIAEAVRLDRLLAAAGAPPLVLKGPALAVLAHVNPLAKHSADLDLLVAPEMVNAAATALDAAGYDRIKPAGALSPAALATWFRHAKEAAWQHPAHGTVVELHGRPLHNPSLMPTLAWTSDRQTVALQPGATVETFAPLPLYAYLAAHGAAHGWARLKWLADLTGLVARGTIDVAGLHAEATRLGAGRCSAQALLLAERLLGLVLPAELARALHADRAAARLTAVALAVMTGRNETAESRSPTGSPLAVEASLFLLRPEWRYRWFELRAKSANPVDRARWVGRPLLSALAPAIGGARWLARRAGLVGRRRGSIAGGARS